MGHEYQSMFVVQMPRNYPARRDLISGRREARDCPRALISARRKFINQTQEPLVFDQAQ